MANTNRGHMSTTSDRRMDRPRLRQGLKLASRLGAAFVAASVLVGASIATGLKPSTPASATPVITIPQPIPNENTVDVCSGVQIGPLGTSVQGDGDADADTDVDADADANADTNVDTDADIDANTNADTHATESAPAPDASAPSSASGPSFFVQLKPGERPRAAREIELIASGLRIDVERGVAAIELSYVNHDESFETKFRTVDPFTGPGEFTLSNDTLMISSDLPDVPLTFEEILLNIAAFGEDQNTELVGVGFTTETGATVNWFEAAGQLYVFETPDCDDPDPADPDPADPAGDSASDPAGDPIGAQQFEWPSEEDPVAPSSVETAVK